MSEARPLLSVSGLAKSFFGVRVLHGVDFDVFPGEALGLVGENGSGKSTCVNIIGGVLKPDAGEMSLNGAPYHPLSPKGAASAGIAFIHQELNLFGNLSIEENLFIERLPKHRMLPLIDRRAVRARAVQLLREVELDLPPTTPVARLSQGERQLIEIAKAISMNAKVVIFDEPTTSLTRHEVDRLFTIIARLKARGIGMIYISHALDDVMAVCERITVLRDGAVLGGGPRDEFSLARIISLMVGRAIDTIYPERMVPPRADPVLRVEGLAQPGVAKDITFDIKEGEVVGLGGLMGSGRSELARMIFGLDAFSRGRIIVGDKVLANPTPREAIDAGMAFLTEDRRGEGLLMDFSIAENTILAALGRFARAAGMLEWRKVVTESKTMAGRVHLSTDRVVETRAKHLSGGNQQKIVIGKWLMRMPKLFILDEPTRGIDVGAKQEVYRIINALVEAGSAVLLISSEIEELMGLSDRILTIYRGELTGSFARAAFDREILMGAVTRPPRAEAG
ncbi:sugar ABC transporter ATP-binding protein [Taklimakanibacter lacteus]|uniref:sugar ABC transporter ATP-binding protein n=1 Tax=Taklimakanibacter lacteus TaxID=2268456 RepID=UPI0034D4E69F